ncbi:hypothetical protein [Saccharopolyspora phatthalungensis]|uniref:Uncharacterized protein n=1 Tax=Saccharopolyspora phatthalungensis TaxID=664693 RepID=A0A840PZJ6_9PSEU|nr:hypothetical protein [Saccharopolyspora phatthalungensis]MBB5153160.1 hypothetical protein [Saccharopolyspora phatthalungensis]
MDLLVLMFVTGFAMATLIFWPLLSRANRRLAESGISDAAAAPIGKHALRSPATPKVVAREPSTDAQPALAKPETAPEAPRPVPVAPQQRSAEPVQIPVLPTDLFAKNFEAKFNRSRQRLARLRDEISKE